MRQDTLDAPLHPNFSIRLMYGFLGEHGFDADAALADAGLSATAFPDMATAISGQQELRMQRAFVAATGYRPDLWLKLGLRYRAPVFGCLGLAMLTAADMVDYMMLPIKRAYTYSLCAGRPIHVDGHLVGLEIDNSEVPPDLQDFCLLQSVGSVVALFSDLMGGPFPFSYVRIALPLSDPAVTRQLPPETRFGTRRTVMYWLPEVSRRPFALADPAIHRILVDQLKKAFTDTVATDPFMVRLRERMEEGGASDVSLNDVADRMGLAPRTLQRRLSDRGLSYRGMLETLRRERAIKMLLSTDRSVTDISASVGFADVTAFEHAFRRWTGESPGQFRNGAAKPAREAALRPVAGRDG